MPKYTIGLDFGTLSGRALLVDISDGREAATAAMDYPHAVMDEILPSGKSLPPDYALQHPQDYLDVISDIIPRVIKAAEVSPDDIIGIGLDFTACTLVPVKTDGTPLCFIDKYRDEPHAYIKLWKHHAAQDQANRFNKIAEERGEAFLARYGGKISSEWLVPKVWQILEEAPEIYDDADYFIEATDWVIWQLTGRQTRNSCTAGYKAVWNKKEGYPSKDFFAALDPRLENLADTKLDCPISPIGNKAGEITKEARELTGLNEGTAVAVGNVDAHVCAPSVKVTGENRMFAIVGTSACHMVMSKKEVSVPGICGYVEDGILPGFFGYEAGQSCCGDHFAWFTENCVPESYEKEAREKGIDIHRLLTEKAAKLRPGESGLIALDWWNGNRSVLVDVDLCGLMIGMTLRTKPEEIYRALIEAVAFGTKKIVENFRENGIEIEEFIAAGGIADKNPLMMQIYADVIGMPVRIAGTAQGPALGSAIFGAIAAGSEKGGYDDVFTAAQKMGNLKDKVYLPDAAGSAVYTELYTEYEKLHDYFGRGENNVMKRLKDMTKRVKGEKDV